MSDETAALGRLRTLQGGRYELEEPIASGGAATVWRAYDTRLDRTVAIKLLHPHLASDQTTVERFKRESRNGSDLSHPNVVRILDYGQDGEVTYLVMEYVEGRSLKDVLDDVGPLDPAVVAALGEQVASALGVAHARGLVHRDVKPANILIGADGTAKVTDFGIAKALSRSEHSLTDTGNVVGTAAYIAPEQMLEDGEIDARADVYALGVVLFECLTGQPAFSGDTPTATAAARLTREVLPPRQIRADVPRQLDAIVVRATRRDPRVRQADGTELANALKGLVPHRPSDVTSVLSRDDLRRSTALVGPVTTMSRASATPRRRRLAAIVVGLAGLVLVAILSSQALREGPIPIEEIEDADLLTIVDVGTLDPPPGDQSERDSLLGNLHDGDLSTAWSTENYRRNTRFGGIKAGVGVWVDLGEQAEVRQAVINTGTRGFSAELLAADQLPDEVDGVVGWGTPVARFTVEDSEISIPVGHRARFWLVWITDLVEIGENQFAADIRQLRFVRG